MENMHEIKIIIIVLRMVGDQSVFLVLTEHIFNFIIEGFFVFIFLNKLFVEAMSSNLCTYASCTTESTDPFQPYFRLGRHIFRVKFLNALARAPLPL